MPVEEERFAQYLDVVQSSASDAEVEQAASMLGIEPDDLDVDQSHRLRDARLERARGKAVESALKRKDASSFGELGGLATVPAQKPNPARRGIGLALLLFLVVAAIVAGAVYFVVFAGESCRTRCCDGTCSSSTGQGTCSYHGGICNDK